MNLSSAPAVLPGDARWDSAGRPVVVEVEMFRPMLARRTMVTVAVAVVTLMVSPAPVKAGPTVPTQLNAADMTLLNGVRQAGLWEIPAGQMAAQKGSSAVVRQVGTMIADQHVQLDQLVVDAANKLGASIPATPTAQQQGWLNEMQNASGARFDQSFVTRLRAAHGKIFPVIGAVRAATRNPVVRKLADQATIFVMNHMKMLESTGLVQYGKLPPAALPPAQDVSAVAVAEANAGIRPPTNPALLWTLLIGTLVLAAFAAARIVGNRR
jgi:predicted outer membrane protein